MTPERLLIWLLAGLLTLIGTGLYRRYALRRQLLDHPTGRSSHVRPTPRGGGLAMAVAFFLGLGWFGARSGIDGALITGLLGGGLLLTLVGAVDDHYPLPPGPRLLAQIIAMVWVSIWLPGAPLGLAGSGPVPELLWRGLELLGLLWFINLYNFMDGLDGLAASEAVFIAVLAAGLSCGSGELVDLFGLLAMCALGFLYWNRPPARIFMGDTGSYFLGFTIASLALLSVRSGVMPLACWLLLPGVFLVDATLTLIRRMLSGKRWLEAHRSHAYQHAARRWGSHGRVMLGVALLNLLWLGPWAWLVAQRPGWAPWAVPAALAPLLVLALWLGAGRRE